MSYTIEKGLLGKRYVQYQCGKCQTDLKSPLDEAGTTDTCPTCGNKFIVPGEKELELQREAELEQRNEQARIAAAKLAAKQAAAAVAAEAAEQRAAEKVAAELGALAHKPRSSFADRWARFNMYFEVTVFRVLKGIFLLISIVVLVVSFKAAQSAIQEAAGAALACFFGILCRIMQAEQHEAQQKMSRRDAQSGQG